MPEVEWAIGGFVWIIQLYCHCEIREKWEKFLSNHSIALRSFLWPVNGKMLFLPVTLDKTPHKKFIRNQQKTSWGGKILMFPFIPNSKKIWHIWDMTFALLGNLCSTWKVFSCHLSIAKAGENVWKHLFLISYWLFALIWCPWP